MRVRRTPGTGRGMIEKVAVAPHVAMPDGAFGEAGDFMAAGVSTVIKVNILAHDDLGIDP